MKNAIAIFENSIAFCKTAITKLEAARAYGGLC